MDKLKWINGIYIRRKSVEELADLCASYLIREEIIDKKGIKNENIRSEIVKSAGAFQNNLKVLGEFPGYVRNIFEEKIACYGKDAFEVLKLDTSGLVLQNFLSSLKNKLNSFDNNKNIDFNEESSKSLINMIGNKLMELKIKGELLYMHIRESITGKTHGPELPKIISILGLENCIQRVNQTLEYIKDNK